MAHGLLVVEPLIPLQQVIDILDPVFACMDAVDTRHWERGHANLEKLVLVQKECLLAIQRHLGRSSGFISNLYGTTGNNILVFRRGEGRGRKRLVECHGRGVHLERINLPSIGLSRWVATGQDGMTVIWDKWVSRARIGWKGGRWIRLRTMNTPLILLATRQSTHRPQLP